MTLNAILFGTPFYLIKWVDWMAIEVLGRGSWLRTLVGPYTLTLIPRLTMLSLSFVVDWCVYQICLLYKHSFNQCLSTLASSTGRNSFVLFSIQKLTD